MNKKIAGLLLFEGTYKVDSRGIKFIVTFHIAADSMDDAVFLAHAKYPKEKIKVVRIGMIGRAQEPGIFLTESK